MKKTGLVLMAMAVISLFSFAVFAQGSSSPADKAGVYVIQKGDTLWWLEGFHRGDPSQWLRIVDDNPFLKEPGRIYEKDGKIIAVIKPGEELKGLVELGILPQEIPVSEFQVVLGAPVESIIFFIMLGLAIAAALYGISRLYRILSDPATSGQPIVQGGLFAGRSRDIETRFQRIAETRAEGDIAPQRIGPIEEGFLSGYGRVQYRDRSEMKRLSREPAFRARFRLQDGTEEDLYFLQRCGNDVTLYRARYFGFTFERTHQVVPEPQPAQTQAGRTSLRVAAVGEGQIVAVTKFRINDLEITVPEGSVFSVTDDKVNISISRAGDIAIGQLKKTKKAKAVKSVAATAS